MANRQNMVNPVEQANFEILLRRVGPQRKLSKTPTAKSLRESAGEPVAASDHLSVYTNGYAVYENENGRTVLFVPDCQNFTYRFAERQATEPVDIPEMVRLDTAFLLAQHWTIPLTLIGEHRIGSNVMNRRGHARKAPVRLDIIKDPKGTEVEESENPRWRSGARFSNPESVLLFREQMKEWHSLLTYKQWQVFVLYFVRGYTQAEIAEILGITQQAVDERLKAIRKKLAKAIENQVMIVP